MSASPTPVQPRKSNLLWWILGIVGGGICLIVVGSVILGLYVARQIHLKQSPEHVEIQTSVGSLKVSKDEAHPTGLPVYPDSMPEKADAAQVEISGAGQKLGLAVEKYNSTHPLDKVQAWYAHRLSSDFRLAPRSNGNSKQRVPSGTMENVNVDDADAAFVSDRGESERVVALKRQGGGTEITLLTVGKREPQ